jgi:hypothetical protein
MRAEEVVDADGIELIDMANLPPEDTGVAGIIYISTAQGQHGAPIKWFPHAPKSRTDPCLSVSVSAAPDVGNLNLPQRMADSAVGPVVDWVALNHVALLGFWDNGYGWTRQQANSFIDGLRKI